MAKHVLLIEDNVASIQPYMTFFLQCPTWILHTRTLQEAVMILDELAAQEMSCALITLSVNLPESAGLAGLVALRNFIRRVSDGVPPVPVIALTGIYDAALRDEIIGWGVREYYVMQENVLPVALPVIVREVLGLGEDNIPKSD